MRLRRPFLALLAWAAAPALAIGQTKPTLWVQMDYSYSISTASSSNCDVIKMAIPVLNRGIVRSGSEDDQFQSALADGIATANALCTVIAGAPPARLAIHLNGFGAGGRYGDTADSNANYWDQAPTLTYHPGDRLASSCSSGPQFQQTPWPDHARAECSAWMKGFCQKFKQRQAADSTIPTPEHISFDCEASPGAGNYLYDSLSLWTTYMDCLMSDHRSGADSSYSTIWRYIPGNLGERKTLAQSYKDARVRYDGESSDTTLPLTSGGAPDPATVMSSSGLVQRLFVTWLNGMWLSVRSDVLDSAVRPALAAYFPGCTFGNYNDMTADGMVDAAEPPYVYASPFGDHLFNNDWWALINGTSGYRFSYDNYSGWNNLRTNNLASIDSPSFYSLNSPSGWVSTTEDYNTEYLRYMGGQLDAINFSADQTRRHHIIPWIAGKPILTGWGFTVDDNWYRDLFALGRAKGVKDYLYFQPNPSICSTEKADINTLMGDVWGPTIGCVTANLGTILNSGDLVKPLAESDAVHLNVSSTYFSGVYAANFIVKLKVPSGFSPSKIKIAVEGYTTFDDSSSPSGTDDTVIAARPYRTTDSTFFGHFATVFGGTTPVPTWGSVAADPGSNFIVSSSTSGVCSSTGNEVWILVGAQTQSGHTPKAFTLHVDHVQVYGYE
jgi:hypothetical protein